MLSHRETNLQFAWPDQLVLRLVLSSLVPHSHGWHSPDHFDEISRTEQTRKNVPEIGGKVNVKNDGI